jgi:hypothetical protein
MMSEHEEMALAWLARTSEAVTAHDIASLSALLDEVCEEAAAVLGGMTGMGIAVRQREEARRNAEIKADGRRAFAEKESSLADLMRRARELPPMTEEQVKEQRASFAYGNLALMRKYRDASADVLAELRARCRRAAGLP